MRVFGALLRGIVATGTVAMLVSVMAGQYGQALIAGALAFAVAIVAYVADLAAKGALTDTNVFWLLAMFIAGVTVLRSVHSLPDPAETALSIIYIGIAVAGAIGILMLDRSTRGW